MIVVDRKACAHDGDDTWFERSSRCSQPRIEDVGDVGLVEPMTARGDLVKDKTELCTELSHGVRVALPVVLADVDLASFR